MPVYYPICSPYRITDTPKLFRHLQARGVVIWCLGVNTTERAAAARSYGVDSILSDDVDFCFADRQQQYQQCQQQKDGNSSSSRSKSD